MVAPVFPPQRFWPNSRKRRRVHPRPFGTSCGVRPSLRLGTACFVFLTFFVRLTQGGSHHVATQAGRTPRCDIRPSFVGVRKDLTPPTFFSGPSLSGEARERDDAPPPIFSSLSKPPPTTRHRLIGRRDPTYAASIPACAGSGASACSTMNRVPPWFLTISALPPSLPPRDYSSLPFFSLLFFFSGPSLSGAEPQEGADNREAGPVRASETPLQRAQGGGISSHGVGRQCTHRQQCSHPFCVGCLRLFYHWPGRAYDVKYLSLSRRSRHTPAMYDPR